MDITTFKILNTNYRAIKLINYYHGNFLHYYCVVFLGFHQNLHMYWLIYTYVCIHIYIKTQQRWKQLILRSQGIDISSHSRIPPFNIFFHLIISGMSRKAENSPQGFLTRATFHCFRFVQKNRIPKLLHFPNEHKRNTWPYLFPMEAGHK